MPRIFLVLASVLGATGVVLGAAGAHALKKVLSADSLASFETAVHYQLFHVLALLALAALAAQHPGKLWKVAGWLFVAGILIFSGSIYLLSTRDATGLTGIEFLGPVTPIGGLCLISGWIVVLIQAIKLPASSR